MPARSIAILAEGAQTARRDFYVIVVRTSRILRENHASESLVELSDREALALNYSRFAVAPLSIRTRHGVGVLV